MLVAVCVDFRRAPLSWRQRLAFGAPEVRDWTGLAGLHGSRESVLLSTCNRTEAYLSVEEEVWPVLRSWILADWTRRTGLATSLLTDAVQVYEGREAVHHLLRVASSLESMLLGEGEILAQVKEAYGLARSIGSVGPELHALFQAALKTGRSVRRDGELGRHSVTPGAAVVRLSETALGGSVHGHEAAVWGSGTMGRRSAEHLAAAGARVTVASRTPEHAQRLVGNLGGSARAVAWTDRLTVLEDADILVLAVRTGEAIFTAKAARAASTRRKRESSGPAPLFVFDFGVPRNTAEDLVELDWVTVRGVDDLREVTTQGQSLRAQAAERAGRAVALAVAEFWGKGRERRAVPLIRSLHAKAEEIAREEVAKSLRRLPEMDERSQAEVERLAHRIVARLLNEPTVALRAGAREEDAETLLRSAVRLFGLEGLGHGSEKQHPA